MAEEMEPIGDTGCTVVGVNSVKQAIEYSLITPKEIYLFLLGAKNWDYMRNWMIIKSVVMREYDQSGNR